MGCTPQELASSVCPGDLGDIYLNLLGQLAESAAEQIVWGDRDDDIVWGIPGGDVWGDPS